MIHRRDVDDLFAARYSIAVDATWISEGFIATRLMVNISDGLGLEGRRPACVRCSVRRSLFNAKGGEAQLITAMRAAAGRVVASPCLATPDLRSIPCAFLANASLIIAA